MSDPTVEDGWGGQKVSWSGEKEERRRKSGLWGAETTEKKKGLGVFEGRFLAGPRKTNRLFQESCEEGRGTEVKETSGPLCKRQGSGRKSNVTPGGKFLDHLLESA